jgi:hypothetical protein
MASELSNILNYMYSDEETAFYNIFNLCKKHGEQIHTAISRMRTIYDDPFREIMKGSFIDFVKEKEYLKPDTKRLCERICRKLDEALPIMFYLNPPKNETDLNAKINGIICGEAEQYGREFPSIQFASIRTVSDHSFGSYNLLIETKYLRGHTGETVVTNGISADIMKYPKEAYLLFLLYDPDRKISSDSIFKETFENKRDNVIIHIIR